MPSIFGIITNTTTITAVVQTAALDVLFVCALLIATIVISRLLETLIVNAIALIAGSGSAVLIESYLTYPGVAYHELSHALFAAISGAKVQKISLRRQQTANGTVLGYVKFLPRGGRILQSFQMLLTNIAPSITGLAGMAAIVLLAFPQCNETWHWVVWGYLLACLLLHSGLSRQDLHGVWAGTPIVLVILFVVFLLVPFDALGTTHTLLYSIPGVSELTAMQAGTPWLT